MHSDCLGGVVDGKAEAVGRVMPKRLAELLLIPDQENREAQFCGSRNRSLNIDHRASVAAHCVKGYTCPHIYLPVGSASGLRLLPFHNLPAAIIPAGRTGAMGELALMTVGTFHEGRDGESVMGATFSCPGITVSTFRKRHR